MRRFMLVMAFALLAMPASRAEAQVSKARDDSKEEVGEKPGSNTDRELIDLVKRGDATAEARLKKKLEQLESAKDWDKRQNLAVLTALRRVQKKADPVTIEVELPSKGLKATTRTLPRLAVALRNVDEEKAAPVIAHGGDYRSGRQARWRFEVRDAKGKLLPQRPWEAMMGGGMYQVGPLPHGEAWQTKLSMEDYVKITEPGEYSVRVLYHDEQTIADLDDVDGLIVCASKPFKLTVAKSEPRVVELAAGARARAKALVGQLGDDGPIKVVMDRYGKPFHDFIDPKSAEGQLHEMCWDAVPGLLDALGDDKLSPRRRGWALAMLYVFTGERDLDPFSRKWEGVLPAYSYRGIGCSGTSSGGAPSATKQRELAGEWLKLAKEAWDFKEKM